MANIPVQEAQGQFTKALMDVYKERVPAMGFLRSFFPAAAPSPTKLVSVMVQRGKEKIAVDVARGAEGRRNSWTQSSEKVFEPLYFRENFDLTQLQFYDRFWGSAPDGSISDATLAYLANNVADNMAELQAKIERSIELMCAQIFTTGKIEMSTQGTGISIDYKRKSESILDPGTGNYWADSSTDPFKQIEAGCKFIRTKGRHIGFTYNLICGEKAIADLLNNTKFKARQNLFNMSIDAILPPQAASEGAAFHGWVTAGPYRINIWSYPQYFDAIGTGESTPYIPINNAILIPNDPKFLTAFGAVPQVIQPGSAPRVGQFVFTDWVSPDKRSHTYEVESCPLPVPVTVDKIYTLVTGEGA